MVADSLKDQRATEEALAWLRFDLNRTAKAYSHAFIRSSAYAVEGHEIERQDADGRHLGLVPAIDDLPVTLPVKTVEISARRPAADTLSTLDDGGFFSERNWPGVPQEHLDMARKLWEQGED